MNFFAREASSRRTTLWLLCLFPLALVATVFGVVGMSGLLFCGPIVLLFLLFRHVAPAASALVYAPIVQHVHVLLWILLPLFTLTTVSIIIMTSLRRIASLRQGGAVVAFRLGGRTVTAKPSQPALARLRDIVEEIAIASNVPVPELLVMPNEPGINAFSAGYAPADAAICVTQGCLDQLSRDELQGVIAHEFSHILNGDIRINSRLIGFLAGIMAATNAGHTTIDSQRNAAQGNAMAFIFGLALIVAGSCGFLVARLIQLAVARSRESLADASAVQFTRLTSGLAGALEKIAAWQVGSSLQSPRKLEVAHMLFGNAGGRWASLFATHPPLPERLEALGVRWDERKIFALAQAMRTQTSTADEPASAIALTQHRGQAPRIEPTAQSEPGTVSCGSPLERDS